MKTKALAFSVALLAGCGGGGGGGGVQPAPQSPGSPNNASNSTVPLLNANSADLGGPAATVIIRTDGSVFLNSLGSTGPITREGSNFTFSVSGVGSEPPFSFTVNLNDPNFTSRNLPGSSQGNCAGNCVKVGMATNGVAVQYLDLAASGMEYSTVGLWARPGTQAGNSEIGGAAAFGIMTKASDIPTTGTASYNGSFMGIYGDTALGIFNVGAKASATANFGSGQVSFETTNSFRSATPGISASDPSLDLQGTMLMNTLNGNRINSMSGTVETKQPGMAGQMVGQFFGPPSPTSGAPKEMSGVVQVSNGSTKAMQGAFGMRTP
jgi:hypothetical protein